MYSVLRLLHGYIHQKDEYINMLILNKFYVIPIVNVDGVAKIEKEFVETGKNILKRKNMNPKYKCNEDFESTEMGVDLNRNYGAASWSNPEGSSTDPCNPTFRGDHPFSEPETRAIRDFMTSHKEELKFNYNFHSYGNMWLWPYNGQKENNIGRINPDFLSLFEEMYSESKFPKHNLNGNAYNALGYISAGE